MFLEDMSPSKQNFIELEHEEDVSLHLMAGGN